MTILNIIIDIFITSFKDLAQYGMESLKQEQVRFMIENFLMENETKRKVHTVKYFKAMEDADYFQQYLNLL